ncbi:uncharacterized protein LOC119604425 [Lucilia sericata]|uniref:uncharacterized protein LOC119604425 n=1 Tax=Lucilia sericata TaxID=13632 RepID=UPI0018A8170E|nr:uncharacterized protein LOC119604425 [Lucilia sericata]
MYFKSLLIFLQIVCVIQQIDMQQVGSYYHYPTNNHTISLTTIERLETYPNGCYKQRIRSPDLSNTTRFFETEEFICPPGVNVTFIPTNTTQNITTAHTYNPQIRPAHTAPIGFMSSSPPAHSAPYAPNPVVIQSPQNIPHTGQQQPFSPAGIPSNTTSQVVVLSKKTGLYDHDKNHRKSSANSLYNINCIFVFCVFLVIIYNFN